MKRYEYRVMKLTSVLALTTSEEVMQMPDVYVSNDAESQFYTEILKLGFRWVRCDSGFAIFEREVAEPDGWQPIATAPTNGEYILAVLVEDGKAFIPDMVNCINGEWGDEDDRGGYYPTHWCRPEPPVWTVKKNNWTESV